MASVERQKSHNRRSGFYCVILPKYFTNIEYGNYGRKVQRNEA